MTSPTVSVVIPMYGVERSIAAALSSVLAQTFRDFEIIAVDDGSPDNSAAIVRRFSPKIRLIRQQNRGLSGARNTGIRHARGRFIALLDGDDQWRSDKLAAHVQHLEANPRVGVSYSRAGFMDADGRRTNACIRSRLRNVTLHHLLLENPVGNGSSPMIRREALDAVAEWREVDGRMEAHFFDERLRYAEDIDCWARIALRTSWRFEGLAAPLTWYRVNPGGLSRYFQQQHDAMQTILGKIAGEDMSIRRKKTLYLAAHAAYLARSAIRMRDSDMATTWIRRAIAYDRRLFLYKPRSALLILLAAHAMRLGEG